MTDGVSVPGGRRNDEELMAVLAMLAPGTELREGIERVIKAGRGALIVIGSIDDKIISGGMEVDIEATPQKLSELAKMDGALILDGEGEQIHHANVHLVPDPAIPTAETGTRHRTAERVAKQTDRPVVSVSESMSVVTLYLNDSKRVLEEVSSLLFRANQALATLERYRARFDEVSAVLSAREIEDSVTVRDVAQTLQRAEMVHRIAGEVEDYVDELGTEGRLIQLQLEELVSTVQEQRRLVVRDYSADRRRKLANQLEALDDLDTDDLLELDHIAAILAYGDDELDRAVTSRGYRQLSEIPRLPGAVIDRLVDRFQTLQGVMDASVDDLDEVDGVGEARAESIQEGLRRLVESSLLERYV